MKRPLLYILLILQGSLFLLSGCSKNLDTVQKNAFNNENFWKDPANAPLALNACYEPLTDQYLYKTFVHMENLTPNAFGNFDAEGYKALADGIQDANNPAAVYGRWKACYRGIGRCNTLLDELNSLGLTGDSKDKTEGEARFLRALYYFNLVDYYGGVPMPLHTPELSRITLPRVAADTIYKQIFEDLDVAAALLPNQPSEKGRAAKAAAWALKAKCYLYNKDWNNAIKACRKVTEYGNGLFQYATSPALSYRYLFMPEYENNNEVIFDVQFKFPELPSNLDVYLAKFNSVAPVQNLIDEYEMTDGKPIATSPLYSPDHPFTNRDSRLYQTIVYKGQTYMGIPIGDANPRPFTGYSFKKYTIYNETAVTPVLDNQSTLNFIVLRYADVMLMLAEALNETQGPVEEAFGLVDAVRKRAGMPGLNRTMDAMALRKAIQHERRIEFAGEGIYYSDIRRWHIAGAVIRGIGRAFVDDRDYLWPIPGKEFDYNPGLVQNPGYGK